MDLERVEKRRVLGVEGSEVGHAARRSALRGVPPAARHVEMRERDALPVKLSFEG